MALSTSQCGVMITPIHLENFLIFTNQNPIPIKHKLLFPLPQPLAIILPSVSMNMTTPGTSYQWNHTACVIFVTVLIRN